MIFIVICKCDTYHEQNRYDVDENYTNTWQSKKGDVKSLVFEGCNVLNKAVDVLTLFLHFLQAICSFDITYIESNKRQNNKDSYDSVEKNQK